MANIQTPTNHLPGAVLLGYGDPSSIDLDALTVPPRAEPCKDHTAPGLVTQGDPSLASEGPYHGRACGAFRGVELFHSRTPLDSDRRAPHCARCSACYDHSRADVVVTSPAHPDGAPLCRDCADSDEETYRAPSIAELVEEPSERVLATAAVIRAALAYTRVMTPVGRTFRKVA